MNPVIPTLRQRVLASPWLSCLWMWGGTLFFCVWCVRSIGPLRYALADVWGAGLLIAVVLMSLVAGALLTVLVGWVVIGSTLFDQGLRNGGPFVTGDLVQVIAGPHRNRVTRVYSTWQWNTVRVELGEEAKQKFQDIFGAYELLRVPPVEGSPLTLPSPTGGEGN